MILDKMNQQRYAPDSTPCGKSTVADLFSGNAKTSLFVVAGMVSRTSRQESGNRKIPRQWIMDGALYPPMITLRLLSPPESEEQSQLTFYFARTKDEKNRLIKTSVTFSKQKKKGRKSFNSPSFVAIPPCSFPPSAHLSRIMAAALRT